MTADTHATNDAYRFIAPVYDACAHVYSAGRIAGSKRMVQKLTRPDDRVLFAGCGTGEEIIAVARAGARVTAVDRSPRMLGRLARRAREARVTIEPRPTDIRTLQPDSDGRFDIVAAHYFLNVFAPEDMPDMLRHLANLTRPGGRLVIADFAPPGANGLRARLQQAYYYTALTTFRLLVPNAWHPIYDYARELKDAGLRLEATYDFPLPGDVLPGYRVWIARHAGRD